MSEPPPPSAPPLSEVTAFVSIRYEPIAEIGAGGMGSIVLARALTGPKRGAFVAIKRLFPHLEKEPKVIASFLDEVWLTSKLHHPNVVEPLDWGRDENGSYLVMQFVAGDSLRALLNAREAAQQPLPVEVVVDVIARAAAGLQAAHSLRSDDGEPLDLVHRDVSPSNIMVGYDGSVKLIDFGVAKARTEANQTETGMVKGKFGYMSPEQIQAHPLDRRSDLFSLGVVAWEALTLCRLYSGHRDIEILRMICDEEPVPPSELRPGVPAELDRIVLRCLAKSPEQRYPDCQTLIDDLRALCPPVDVAKERLASIAREAMPDRLAWIEQVTGEAVPREESAPFIEPDPTVRTEPPSEIVLRAIAEGRSVAPTPFAPDPTVVSPPPSEALVVEAVPDVESVRGKSPPAAREGSWTTTRSSDAIEAPTTPRAMSPAIGAPALVAPHGSLPFAPPPAPRDDSTLRYLVVIGAFGAIVFFATMFGAWLGRR
jgi:serine/threonine protein kinase